MKHRLHFVLAVVGILFSSMVFGQGVTTGSMNGLVKGSDGETLPGANVVAVHTPTGSTYGTVTREDGRFNLPNIRVGGPYTVTVSFIGYQNFVQSGLNVNLGQDLYLAVDLSEDAQVLEAVVINAGSDVINSDRTGAQTKIDEATINTVPTINRDISDFAKLTPQASVNGEGINIANTNNRFNAIFIDGAVNNDVFGLAASGTNGGQTGISPIALDAIEQFQISVAPYDVTLGGFAGGGINAVTRSGTNEIEGSVYFFTRNQTLTGRTNPYVYDPQDTLPLNDEVLDSLRTRVPNYASNIIGFRLGGPLVKDKAFFFVNAELQRENTPQPFVFSNYQGDLLQEDIDNLASVLQNQYGYDPGGYLNNARTLTSDKFLVKLDYNLNSTHKLSLRHSYVKGVSTSPQASNNTNINFENGGILFPTTTNSTALELNSLFNSEMSNNLIIGYTNVMDDRDAMGADFPRVRIRDGSGNIFFGSEEFSTANQLNQGIFTITDNLKLYKGKHTFTIGTHNEFYSIYNLFIRQAFGSYDYNSLDDFLNGGIPRSYAVSYSLVDDVVGDGSAAAADFNAMQLGLYGQDKIQVNEKLNVTLGLRFDMPIFTQDPVVDNYFNDTAIANIEAAGYDLGGARSGQMPGSQLMISPRIGFNYDVKGDQTFQIRGGVGIFTSRIPFVWPAGSYTNNGVLVGGTFQDEEDIIANLPDFVFEPNPYGQYQLSDFGGTDAIPQGQMDIFVEDFKFPQVLRASAAIDKKLPNDMFATIEGILTKTLNNVVYYNVNQEMTSSNFEGPDNRPFWPSTKIEPNYSRVILGDNTSEGYGYSITAQLQKNFSRNFTASLAYTYGDAYAINDGTSSQNSSQWRFMENVNGRNNLDLTRSDFAMGARVVGFISKRFEYGNNFATTLALFYSGQSGRPFSYIYNSSLQRDDSGLADLIFVPDTQDDIVLVETTTAGSVEDQWAALDAFITGDEYLNSRRGDYAERNGDRTPFENIWDLKIIQDVMVNIGETDNTLQVSLDILNFANLLNPRWGNDYFLANDNYSLLRFEGWQDDVTGGTPTFSFTEPANDIWSLNDLSSRWRIQFGVRYIFN
jgi:hypothetical protein